MDISVVQFQPKTGELVVADEAIARRLADADAAPGRLAELIASLRPVAIAHCDICCGYALHPARVHRDHFVSGERHFACGARVAAGLRGSTQLAFTVATLGERFDEWSRAFFAEGDALAGSVADAIGSVALDVAFDWIADKIRLRAEAAGFRPTSDYRPGLLDWDEGEVRRLFEMLPDGLCGVQLTPSALMVPLKSLSAVIGMGVGARRLTERNGARPQPISAALGRDRRA